MAYKITDACIACGACAAECPVEAIAEGDNIYVVDADKCIDCGSCADACPVDAPVEAYSTYALQKTKTTGQQVGCFFCFLSYASSACCMSCI